MELFHKCFQSVPKNIEIYQKISNSIEIPRNRKGLKKPAHYRGTPLFSALSL